MRGQALAALEQGEGKQQCVWFVHRKAYRRTHRRSEHDDTSAEANPPAKVVVYRLGGAEWDSGVGERFAGACA